MFQENLALWLVSVYAPLYTYRQKYSWCLPWKHPIHRGWDLAGGSATLLWRTWRCWWAPVPSPSINRTSCLLSSTRSCLISRLSNTVTISLWYCWSPAWNCVRHLAFPFNKDFERGCQDGQAWGHTSCERAGWGICACLPFKGRNVIAGCSYLECSHRGG